MAEGEVDLDSSVANLKKHIGKIHSFFYTRIVFFEVSLKLILRNWKIEP